MHVAGNKPKCQVISNNGDGPLSDDLTKPIQHRTERRAPATGEWRLEWPNPVLSVLLIASHVVLEWLGFMHAHDGVPITPWSPGHGVMFAALILGGRQYGLVFFVGVLLAEFSVLRTSLPLPVLVLTSAIIAGTYTAVAEVSRSMLNRDRAEFLTRDILVLFAAGLAGSLVVSMLLCVTLLSIDHFDLADIARTAVPLILGDLIGIVVVTPLVLRAYAIRSQLISRSQVIAAELALLSAAVLPLLILATWPGLQQPSLFYLLFMPIVVAAVRYGIDGACASLALVQLILIGLLHFHGVDLSRFTEYQMLMLVLTLTGLVVGALVSERRQADEATRQADERLGQMQAEAARAARLNLVSGMAAALAHEINQPTTAARALARSVQEILKAPKPDYERARANLATMIEQIDHAGSVVSRMREFLRRGEPHLSTVDTSIVLSESLALVRPLAAMRQIELEAQIETPLPQIWADRVQLQQVVINLIRNSVDAIAEAGRSDGTIRVMATSSERTVEISVRDNGAGINPDLVDTLFEPMSTSRMDGTGLGLSICKTIVEAHGGRIWLADASPGRTEFRFSLPTAPDATRSRS